jgi:hypothetical protein
MVTPLIDESSYYYPIVIIYNYTNISNKKNLLYSVPQTKQPSTDEFRFNSELLTADSLAPP